MRPNMKRNYLPLILIFCLAPFSINAQTITLEEFGPTFSRLTNLGSTGISTDTRMFVSEQKGFIKILEDDGTSPATPFLDIDSKVFDDIVNYWETGLHSFVFHPDYETNGYFYVHYSDNNLDAIVSRFTRIGGPTSNVADASSELVIINMSHPYDAHYGGDLAFGPDGYLYITKGDGGTNMGDPDNRSQDLSQLHGKILRIDVDNVDPGKNYGIPARPGTPPNPYADDGDVNTLPEIWASGLRNPAKFSFDSSTGDMWIGDVGQWDWEEINFIPANSTGGQNFGWRCYEGPDTYNTSAGCPPIGDLTFGIADYNHNESDGIGRCAVAGGYVHRGSVNTSLNGYYFFGDWCSGEIFTLSDASGSWVRTNHPTSVTYKSWTAFGVDNNKELYVASNGLSDGKVSKIKSNLLSDKNPKNILDFSITPNPTNQSNITLNFSNTNSIKEINTYNIHGQYIKSDMSRLNSKTISLEYSKLSTGIYIVEAVLISGEKSQNKLIIK